MSRGGAGLAHRPRRGMGLARSRMNIVLFDGAVLWAHSSPMLVDRRDAARCPARNIRGDMLAGAPGDARGIRRLRAAGARGAEAQAAPQGPRRDHGPARATSSAWAPVAFNGRSHFVAPLFCARMEGVAAIERRVGVSARHAISLLGRGAFACSSDGCPGVFVPRDSAANVRCVGATLRNFPEFSEILGMFESARFLQDLHWLRILANPEETQWSCVG